ncbi:hypothetical protein ACU4GD_31760 [Cupriavidus basilensis]
MLGSAGSPYEHLVNEGAGSPYAAWYPDHGGNVLVRTVAVSLAISYGQLSLPRQEDARAPAAAQPGQLALAPGQRATRLASIPLPLAGGSISAPTARKPVAPTPPIPTATSSTCCRCWWVSPGSAPWAAATPTVDVGGNAGMLNRRGSSDGTSSPRSEGLVLAVASTGRVAPGGQWLLTGGGDMDVHIGGDLNPGLRARAAISPGTTTTASTDFYNQNLNLNGVLTNLRGGLDLQTGSVGGIALNYGGTPLNNDLREGRAYNPFNATLGTATGGVVLMLGDAAAHLSTRGDLVLAGTGDPGRISTQSSSSFTFDGKSYGDGGYGWFSLWSERTAIHLFSAGGNLTPSVQLGTVGSSVIRQRQLYRWTLPLSVAVEQCGRQWQHLPWQIGAGRAGRFRTPRVSLSLAPFGSWQPAVAGRGTPSMPADTPSTNPARASRALPTPFRPALHRLRLLTRKRRGDPPGHQQRGQRRDQADHPAVRPLFAFGANTAAAQAAGEREPARFYAAQGDIVGLRTGEILAFTSGQRTGQTWYESAGPGLDDGRTRHRQLRHAIGPAYNNAASDFHDAGHAAGRRDQHWQPVRAQQPERCLGGFGRPGCPPQRIQRCWPRHSGNQRRPQHPDGRQRPR